MKSRELLSVSVATAKGMIKENERASEFVLKSRGFEPGAVLTTQYQGDLFGCSGGNLVPDLYWSNAPSNTKSFAVTLYDNDAPTGSGFWHWIVFDISKETAGLPGGKDSTALPAGAVEANTDLGKPGFFGPCPPPGRVHNYVYSVYALDIEKLPAANGASPALVGFAIWQHQLAKATLGFRVGPRAGSPIGPCANAVQ